MRGLIISECLLKCCAILLICLAFIHFSLIFSAKVGAFITCKECRKRRLVYSQAKLTTTELRSVTQVEEELVCTCGNPLFYVGQFRDKIVVKEGLSCSSEIEAAYYAGTILKKELLNFLQLYYLILGLDQGMKGYRNYITKH